MATTSSKGNAFMLKSAERIGRVGGGTWCELHWVIGSRWRQYAHGGIVKGLLCTSGRKKQPEREKKGVALLI